MDKLHNKWIKQSISDVTLYHYINCFFILTFIYPIYHIINRIKNIISII